MPTPRIALIHALEESVIPARLAFEEVWPAAYTLDLLDTSLAVDLSANGTLDSRMINRFRVLGRYAAENDGHAGRACAILFTCSAFGPAIEAVKAELPIPVLRPAEAAFREALEWGERIGLIVSFGPSLRALETELRHMAEARGRTVAIRSSLAEGALTALKRGDTSEHDRLVAQAVTGLGPVDSVILGQFSLARARPLAQAASTVPVITTPHSAARTLRQLVEGDRETLASMPSGA